MGLNDFEVVYSLPRQVFGAHVRKDESGKLLGFISEEEIEISGMCACDRVLRARGVRSQKHLLRRGVEKMLVAHRQICDARSEVRWVVETTLPEVLKAPSAAWLKDPSAT